MKGAGEEKKPGRWRGSILLFDQSVSTQTIGLGKDYTSANSSYEWWFAFKPRYFAWESESRKDTISLNLWMNLYFELTNSDTTTRAQEPILGPTSMWASYAHTFVDVKGWKTSVTLGPRLTLPTDRASRATGQYFGMGATGGFSQAFPIAGKNAPYFAGGRIGISSVYTHPIHRAVVPTTSNAGNIPQTRQDAGGNRLFADDRLGGSFNSRDSLNATFSAGLTITPKVDFGVSYVVINSWPYHWTDQRAQDTPIQIATGPAIATGVNDPSHYRVNTWALVSLDYELMDELSLGIGYYNLTNQLGPDGKRRSPLWSPDARGFVTLTGNLDAIYARLTQKSAPAQTAQR